MYLRLRFSAAIGLESVTGLNTSNAYHQIPRRPKLKEKQPTNSKTSSKPPSTDLLEKSEKAKSEVVAEGEQEKRKPGGQPGNSGKTRKGFGRVDRYELSEPEKCECFGSRELSEIISLSKQQVASLVAMPIEVVEYQTAKCKCLECGAVVSGAKPLGVVPGQDLSVGLQALRLVGFNAAVQWLFSVKLCLPILVAF